QRTDEYGGDFAGRSRFLFETVAAVRAVWPEHLPLTARFGVIEFDSNDQETLQESIELTRQMKALGLDLLNVSVGFTIAETNIPWGPAFLGPIAQQVKQQAALPVASSWGIDTPQLAENAVASGQMDLVMIGRAHLANPHWGYVAAQQLQIDNPAWVLPAPYA